MYKIYGDKPNCSTNLLVGQVLVGLLLQGQTVNKRYKKHWFSSVNISQLLIQLMVYMSCPF